MSDTITYNIRFDSNGNAVLDKISGAAAKVQQSISRTQGVCDKFGASFIKLEAVKNAIDGVGQAFGNIMKPGMDVQSSMADLSAITGVTGQKLEEIEGYARKAAQAFGGSAAQSVESYKLILSQLGPEIAKTPKALEAMGNSVAVLSKTMGGDSVAATEVLTTAMNQFQVSLDDPTQASKAMADMMNVMAAAAKEGSAELPQIKMALEQSGMAAKMAGVSFAETNAAIQVLDKAGKKGAEGGVALRNVMAKLSEGRFMPKDVIQSLKAAGIDVNALGDKSLTLSDRLNLLKPVLSDTALLSKMFGLENANAATALISGTGLMDQYNTAIQGTNTAYDQAATVMETTAEKMSRMKAKVDDMKIGMFELAGASYPYIDMLVSSMAVISDLVPAMMLMRNVILYLTNADKMRALWLGITNLFTKESIIVTTAHSIGMGIAAGATWLWTAAQTAFNAVMAVNPVVWIVMAVLALIAAITYVIYKTDGWGKQWDSVVNFMKYSFQAFVEAIKLYFNTFIDGFMIGLDYIKIGWYKFKEATGLGDSTENKSAIAKINSDIEARQKAIVDGAKKVMDLQNKANGSLKWELSWNSDRKIGDSPIMKKLGLGSSDKTGTETAGKLQAGIAPADLPGMKSAGSSKPGNAPKKPATGTTDAIASGGTRNTEIHINLKNMVETIRFDGSIKENRSDLQKQVEQIMLQVLNMARATA